jgi:small subunit ribosomal protein S27Ae
MAAPEKKAAPAKGKGYSVSKLFEKQGGKIVAKNKHCPKCGPGVYMASHKDRVYCGACHYSEFTTKK